MRHQVGAADYQRCVDDGACRALDRNVAIATDRPAVQVSWHDAEAYAGWLSRKTGDRYRLPTDEEWAFAAGSKFGDDALPVDDNDPSKRWISRYERESDRDADDNEAHAFGSFGANENGLLDLARQCLGMDHRPVSCAPRWTMRAARFRRMPIAASASPRAGTAPMSPISSATPAPAAARPACRRTISAFGWYASSHHG